MSFVPTPEQVQYQLEHPGQTRAGVVIGSTATLLVLAYVGVALRCLARWKSKVRFGSDDLSIFLALLFLTAFGVVLFVCVNFGFGKHVIYASNDRGLVISYVLEVAFYCTATVFTKASILFLYCRIFRSKNLFRLSLALIVFVIAYNVACLLVTVLECIPLSDIWTGNSTRCIDTKPPVTAIGSVNVATGFAILIIPIRFVLKLNMDNFRKFQVCCVFLTGGITCAFGIVRVVVFSSAGTGDLSYDLVWPAVWAFCETSIGILAACLPTMGIFFSRSHRISQGPPGNSRHTSTRSALSTYFTSVGGSISKRISRLSVSVAPRSPTKSLFGSADHEKLTSRDPIMDNVIAVPPTPTRNAYNTSGDTCGGTTAVDRGEEEGAEAAKEMREKEPEEPRWVLDVRIPDYSLQRNSANTDSLTRWLVSSTRNSARSSVSWFTGWNGEMI